MLGEVVRVPQRDRRNWIWLSLLLCGLGALKAFAEVPTNSLPSRDLTIQEVVRRVVEFNESVQMKMLEAEISRKTLKAEKGIYEPAVVGTVEHIDSQRPNNIEEQRSLLTAQLDERNTLYDGGLEFLSPLGGKFKIEASFHDLHNNLQQQPSVLSLSTNPVSHEYETFVGLSLVQPLLKNFGIAATEVRIRLAAAASDLAYQDYRRQLMLTVGRAESAYWDLYLTQEQERITAESANIAQTVLDDNENRLKVGRTSELEVMQARAGLELRKARNLEARSKRFDGVTQLATLLSEPGLLTNSILRAADKPVMREVPLSYFDNYQQAFELNPDYLSRKIQVNQETIRLAYARNQRLPQLDLKANYGFNGLGDTPSASWDDIGRYNFPAWSIGLDMRVPITGGVKERNEFEAAKLSQQKAFLGLREVEIQIGNALDSAIYKTRSYLDNVESYNRVVQFHQELIASQLERLKVGRLDTLTVLQTEDKLFEARIAELENMVQYQKAYLELELVTGSTLQVRHLDLTKPQLQKMTEDYLRGRLSPAALQKYEREAAKEYYEDLSPESLGTRKALEVLHKEIKQQDLDAQRKAVELLRQRIRQEESAPPVLPGSGSVSPAVNSKAPTTPVPGPSTADPETQRKALELLRQKMRESGSGVQGNNLNP
jgi:outer membrane protein TolC